MTTLGEKVDYHGTQATVMSLWTGPVYQLELPGGAVAIVPAEEVRKDWR